MNGGMIGLSDASEYNNASNKMFVSTYKTVIIGEDIHKHFRMKTGFFGKQVVIKAVDGISFTIFENETLSLVGESGSGKTTVGKIALKIIEPTRAKRLEFMGRNLLSLKKEDYWFVRRHASMVYQNPLSSFNPWWTIRKIIREPLDRLNVYSQNDRDAIVEDIIRDVGLSIDHLERNPRDLSGGQQQRVAIARAIVHKPRLVVLDEPTSALDVSMRASILDLLLELQRKHGITYLLITHDISTAFVMSRRISVMYMGEIVEEGNTKEVINKPLHPYTRGLIQSIPLPDPDLRNRYEIKGEIPSQIEEISGCKFNPRCPLAFDKCRKNRPGLKNVDRNRKVACFLY